MPAGILALWLFLLLVFLLPVLIADIFVDTLTRLGLSPGLGLLVVVAMFVGSMFNVPVYRQHNRERRWPVESVFYPFLWRRQAPRYYLTEQVIALNVGGCLIPLGLVVYQLWRLQGIGFNFWPLILAVLVTTGVCYRLSRLVTGVGVLMPAFIPGILAALLALLLAPDQAPAVAFCSGVLGTLLGADMLRLPQLLAMRMGSASIGGAGTFDGIVISGFVAAMLV